VSLLVNTTGIAFVLDRSDNGATDWSTNGDLYSAKIWDRSPADDYGYDTYFGNEWWPSRSSLMGGWDGEPSNQLIGDAQWWGWPWTKSGAPSQMVFTGFTRDVYGSVLPACIVKCFRTADHTLQSSTTSDANGLYWLSTPYVEAHYLVVHKAGSPEVAGATVSSLLPA
jgi:hypothetical protein